MCIRYRGNVFTEQLPSNDKGIFTETLPNNDKETFTEPLPSNDRGDTQTHTEQRDLISLLSFFQNKESRIKMWRRDTPTIYEHEHVHFQECRCKLNH
jgi:hypothetical protein